MMEGIQLEEVDESLPVWAQRMYERQQELTNRCTLLENLLYGHLLPPAWAQQLILDVRELKMRQPCASSETCHARDEMQDTKCDRTEIKSEIVAEVLAELSSKPGHALLTGTVELAQRTEERAGEGNEERASETAIQLASTALNIGDRQRSV